MPPPPAPQTIAAAIDALRADATSWLTAAAALAAAGAAAGTLTLDAGRLSAAAEATGLTGVYAEVQHRTATLLAEAARTGTATAAALGAAADAYESDERTAVHRLRGQW